MIKVQIIFNLFLFALLISCLPTKHIDKTTYIGGFSEEIYDFFESISHKQSKSSYYELPFDLKFGGIRPYPYDSIGKKDFSWLRDPENLTTAFSSFAKIGLDNFISREKYFQKNKIWCCNTDWENKSLHHIVTDFIQSDTTSTNSSYHSKFWKRRREENNLSETYRIFLQIDNIYNTPLKPHITSNQQNYTLTKLLSLDAQLIHYDSTNYSKTAIEYFNFLKTINLNYSAYKLIFNNPKIKLNKASKDSLLSTMNYKILTREEWLKLDDNINGWMNSNKYPDSLRYYGP